MKKNILVMLWVVSLPFSSSERKPPKRVVSVLWWKSACTNRAENKPDFTNLMQRVKEFKEKRLISPEGEN